MEKKKNSLKDIETKDDGKNAERFGNLLNKVVNVPKKEILEREAKEKAMKDRKERD